MPRFLFEHIVYVDLRPKMEDIQPIVCIESHL